MVADRPMAFLPGSAGDRALVARLVAGEEVAYRECYRIHAPRIFALLLRILRDRPRAEEILQETFLAVFGNIGRYRAQARLGTWIHEIAIRRALNALRDDSRRLPAGGQPCDDQGEPSGESRLASRDLARRMLALMDRLPDEQRAALLLAAEGYTAAEIATLTNAPRATVLARLARGRARLLALATGTGVVEGLPPREGAAALAPG
jgi:RNA polymerase sigma-70 factor (ECF subfamily)